jgi:hypothetical protein
MLSLASLDIVHRSSASFDRPASTRGTRASGRPTGVHGARTSREFSRRSRTSEARLVLVGGAAMDGPHHIWWNFVSSRKERIEQAKADWKLRRFDTVPGDEAEFIPLQE